MNGVIRIIQISFLTLCLSALQAVCTPAQAQNESNVVQPIQESSLWPLNFGFGVFLEGGGVDCGTFWKNLSTTTTGVEPIHDKGNRMYGTHLKIGAETTATMWNKVNITASLGYKYANHAYGWDPLSSDGITSHWLSTDLNFNWTFIHLGMVSDIFLDSQTSRAKNYHYEGLNRDCFNRVSLAMYGGIQMTFSKFKVQLRYSFWPIIPHLNPNKLAYYNMERVNKIKNDELSIRLSYSLFTTKRVYDEE
jgi:hypothetical protein